jgi:hypothetical protein
MVELELDKVEGSGLDLVDARYHSAIGSRLFVGGHLS